MPTIRITCAGQVLEQTLEPGSEVRIGRSPDGGPALALKAEPSPNGPCYQVQAALRSLSQQHAQFAVTADGALRVQDLGSKNGTYLRLQSGGSAEVPDGGEVLLGRDLSVVRGQAQWPLPDEGALTGTPEALCALIDQKLRALGAEVRLDSGAIAAGAPSDQRIPLLGAGQLLVRWHTATVHSEAEQWLSAVVSLYNSQQANSAKHGASWDFVAASAGRMQALRLAERIAGSSCSVLIRGATGCGKEVLAQDIHNHSRRAKKEFIAINCAAIPENLFESELFGHERGAYTGATERYAGRFVEADGGTLFLDELAELPLPLQSKLLRVLQDGVVRPVGSSKDRKVDVRVLAATNGNLEKLVAEGKFRADLLYRLNTVQISIPALLPADVQTLTQALLRRVSKKLATFPGASERAELAALASTQTWPGGARQLGHTLERYLLLADPAATTAANWHTALTVGAPTPDAGEVTLPLPPKGTSPPPAPVASPLSAAKLIDNLLFLATAKSVLETNHRAGVSEIAAQVGLTYQGAANRLRNLDIKLDGTADLAKLINRIEEERTTLSPYLPWLQGVLRG
jgi:DNA-binding NtrC family response regulator